MMQRIVGITCTSNLTAIKGRAFPKPVALTFVFCSRSFWLIMDLYVIFKSHLLKLLYSRVILNKHSRVVTFLFVKVVNE